MNESLQTSLQVAAELLLMLAVVLLATRWLFGYVAQFAAWVDSGFRAAPGPVTTGSEGMLLRSGVARTPLDPRGKVKVGGELWHAVASEPVPAGEEVEILAVEGLTLRVKPRRRELRPESTSAPSLRRSQPERPGESPDAEEAAEETTR